MRPQLHALNEAEVSHFCPDLPDVQRRLDGDLAIGTVRPQWCWQADDGGIVLARHHWWAPAGVDPPIVLVPVSSEDAGAAAQLIGHAARMLGVTRAWCSMTMDGGSGDPWRDRARDVRALEAAGFSFAVDRVRVEWRAGVDPAPSTSMRLTFTPSTAYDADALVELFASVADGSLDHGMRTEAARLGPVAEARERLGLLAGYPGLDNGFLVASRDSDVVGYVAPAVDAGLGVVAEIGVARAHRGHRYADDLLAHSVEVLRSAGVTRIVADTDCANTPMRSAFARAGFREHARRWDWALG
jgi:ribosomal protein S18 acetylase RimI-like enzyme